MPTEDQSTNATAPFQREDRYIVIKRSDLDRLAGLDRHLFSQASRRAHEQMFAAGAPARSFLVIESDWPEFEPTWAAIEARMAGNPVGQHQGEPVGALLIDEYFDSREIGEVDVQLDSKVCDQLAEKYPGQSFPLYIHPAPADAGEVEQLVAANTEYARRHLEQQAEVERLRSIERSYDLREELLTQVKGERDRMITRTTELAAQLAELDELLLGLLPWMERANEKSDDDIPELLRLRAAISASAELSEPVERKPA